MIPAARVQAAIEVLDLILGGAPAEQALTGWARRSRYAGSGDRAAVRDHVFEALRRMRSDAARGGAQSGRGLMLGALRRRGEDPDMLFCDLPHAPAPLGVSERSAGTAPASDAERLDLPDWLWPRFAASLGPQAEAAALALQDRAPVHLRVNTGKVDLPGAQQALASDGIDTRPHPAAETALEVTGGSRKIRQSAAYRDGWVELQDAASQAVVAALPLRDGMRMLDFCAGGGGKTLAMAARARLALFAHDAAPQRMRDLPQRAARAGVEVEMLDSDALATVGAFDLVLCDAPCSGSGAWRRAPEGKWRLTADQLQHLGVVQAGILAAAARLVVPGGVLAYATCSILDEENGGRIAAFLRSAPEWRLTRSLAWPVEGGTDGFYTAQLTRE